MTGYSTRKFAGLKNEEKMYSFFCVAICVSLIFWTLLNSIFCLLLFVYWLLLVTKDFNSPGNKKYWIILFCALYFVVLISALYSANIKEAISKLQHKSAFLLFPIIFGSSVLITKTVFSRSVQAFTFATFSGSIFCIIRGVYKYLQTDSRTNLYGYKLVFPLKDMTPFMMSMCCLFSLLFLFDKIRQRVVGAKAPKFVEKTLVDIIGIIFLFSFLLVLGNRSVLIAAAGIIIFYCFKLLKELKLKMLVLGISLGLCFTAIQLNPYLKSQWNELANFSKQNSIILDKDASLGKSWGGAQLRLAIWQCSLDVIRNNWIVGVGIGDAQDSLQAAYEKRKFYFASRYNKYNTHNQYLQEAVANGIAGLFIFLAGLIAPLFASMERQDKQFYILFIFCFAFGCLTDTPLELNKGIILYSFFNALIFFKSYNFNDKLVNGNTTTSFRRN